MKNDFLTHLILEADAYRSLEDIEKLVEKGSDLSAIPIQPLFMAAKAATSDQLATLLPRFSEEQRQAMLDLDLWKKDEIDYQSGVWWLEVYSRCPDDHLRAHFAQSEDFLLLLKNQCTIQTFDAEDPHYPESDSYFLTEDNLLLIEYPEDFSYVLELKQLVRDLYTELGVEKAYAHLFKMVSDSYMVMEEDNYQRKKERLRDYGFLDYYDAIELDGIFMDLKTLDAWIEGVKIKSAELDSELKNQALHSSSLVSYQNGMEKIKDDLEKITDQNHKDFLLFTFVRLVNARIIAEDALKAGSVAMTRVGARARQRMELGHSYLKMKQMQNPFEKFDFTQIYKIGNSLLEIQKRQLKQALHKTPFHNASAEFFLGLWWSSFLDHSFDEPCMYKIDGSSSPKEVNSFEIWQNWTHTSLTLTQSLPFIQKFWVMMQKLMESQQLHDGFYLNYKVEDIDFEAIMLSSLINFSLGHFDKNEDSKMGVTIDELKLFYGKFFKPVNNEWILKGEQDSELMPLLESFSERFGLNQVSDFSAYLYQIMVEQMNSYEIMSMPLEDFKHIGGPIILGNQLS
jgi:hypothetical protein